MTLGRKWQQMYYVKLAMLSDAMPDRPSEEIAQAVESALKELGKDHFLECVARGIVRELVQLRLWRDALAVFWMFSRQLPWKARVRVAQGFGGQISAVWSARLRHQNS